MALQLMMCNLTNDSVAKKNPSCSAGILDIPTKPNTTAFTGLSTIRQVILHLSSAFIVRLSSFGYVIYFSADASGIQCALAHK